MAENKIAVIGDRDSVMLWRAVGIKTVFADGERETERAVNRLAREGVEVIYMTEKAASLAKEAVEKYRREPFPAIIPIPDKNGSTGLGMKGIKENVEKAVGADILFENEEAKQ